MAIVDQLNIFLENKPGSLKRFCDVLRDHGINMRALLLPDHRDYGVVRLVVDDAEEAIEILKDAKILALKSPAIAVELENRPGALGEIAERLAGVGVDIDYAYGSSAGERATLILGVSDLERAHRALEGHGTAWPGSSSR